MPGPLLEKARMLGEIDLAPYFTSAGSEEIENQLRAAYTEFQEIVRTRMGVWKWATRRWVIEHGVDYERIFWEFAEERRASFAAYIRTDGRFMRELRQYLERVRSDRQSDPIKVGLENARFPLLPYALKERE